jgi:hypothetical protein
MKELRNGKKWSVNRVKLIEDGFSASSTSIRIKTMKGFYLSEEEAVELGIALLESCGYITADIGYLSNNPPALLLKKLVKMAGFTESKLEDTPNQPTLSPPPAPTLVKNLKVGVKKVNRGSRTAPPRQSVDSVEHSNSETADQAPPTTKTIKKVSRSRLPPTIRKLRWSRVKSNG